MAAVCEHIDCVRKGSVATDDRCDECTVPICMKHQLVCSDCEKHYCDWCALFKPCDECEKPVCCLTNAPPGGCAYPNLCRFCILSRETKLLLLSPSTHTQLQK